MSIRVTNIFVMPMLAYNLYLVFVMVHIISGWDSHLIICHGLQRKLIISGWPFQFVFRGKISRNKYFDRSNVFLTFDANFLTNVMDSLFSRACRRSFETG